MYSFFFEVRGTINRLPLHARSIAYYVHTHRPICALAQTSRGFRVPRNMQLHRLCKIHADVFIRATFFSQIKRIIIHRQFRLHINPRLYERDFGSAFSSFKCDRARLLYIYMPRCGNCAVFVHLLEFFVAIKLLMRQCPARRWHIHIRIRVVPHALSYYIILIARFLKQFSFFF